MTFHPTIERLPDRIVPAVFVIFSNGTLNVFGDGADNDLLVSESAGVLVVSHNGSPVAIRGNPAPLETATSLVRIFSSDGDDLVTIDPSIDALAGTVGPRVSIVGGSGHDTIIGSATQSNDLDGQDGNDVIVAGSGADRVFGGNGDDEIDAGGGADLVYGQVGNDSLLGGDGADTLLGQEGDDSIDGGAGTDYLAGLAGNDTIFADDGEADTVLGAGGDDLLLPDGTDSVSP